GPRAGAAGAGGSIPGLGPNEQSFFNAAISDFMEVDSVSGSIPGEGGSGLGPTFNGNSCAQCHAQPAIGGSSPGLRSPKHPVPNSLLDLAILRGACTPVPSFCSADGPVREARFIRHPIGSLDGCVQGLYTITSRSDADGCSLAQPNVAQS